MQQSQHEIPSGMRMRKLWKTRMLTEHQSAVNDWVLVKLQKLLFQNF